MIVDQGCRFNNNFERIWIDIENVSFFFKKAERQHDAISANESRLVTKIRWTLESINDLIKMWKMMVKFFSNIQISYIGDYV